MRQKIQHFKRFVENYRRHIACFVVVYGMAAGLCLERCYCEWKYLFLVTLLPVGGFPDADVPVQTMFSRLNLRASPEPRWWAWPSPAARLPPSLSCSPACSSPCAATSSRCAARPSSTDTFRLTPPSISMASWP